MNKFWNFASNDDGTRTLYLCGSIADESWFDDDVTPKAFRADLEAGTRVLMSPVALMMIHNPLTVAIGDTEEM